MTLTYNRHSYQTIIGLVPCQYEENLLDSWTGICEYMNFRISISVTLTFQPTTLTFDRCDPQAMVYYLAKYD